MTLAGFKPKRLADLLSDLNADLARVKDPISGEYLDPATDPLVAQLNSILMPALADCWDAAYQLSTQFDPLKASGALLEGLVQLNGILKFPGTPTTIILQLNGVGTVPAGKLVANEDATVIFATDEDVELAGAAVNVSATCRTNGAISPAFGTIVNILTPLPGWTSAQNIGLSVLGSDPETSTELRARQQTETANTGYRQIEAIYAAVRNIPGVAYVRAYQNRSITDVDARGLPPKTVSVVVVGGNDTDVATAIYKREPAGMGYYGNTSVELGDIMGFKDVVSFRRPNPVVISVEVNVTVVDDTFPDDGDVQIAAAIADYAQFSDTDAGYAPGEDVYLSRLYTPANSIPGHSIDSILISRDGNPPAADPVSIGWDEIAVILKANTLFTYDTPELGWDIGRHWVAGASLGSITVNVTRP